MADPLARKIVLVVRQTRLDELVARYNTIEQARFYIEHLGSDFSDYLSEHVSIHHPPHLTGRMTV